ncbi:MAG TPA: acyl-CoA thioesterase II [Myxococcales bacterium]|nr:acyl-CoA thioesterase II [Myxococcales bacterium]HIL80784.1 acyl-CoA thioesterase II [Myxococcales bacterium]
MAIIRWEDTLACLDVEFLGADSFTAPNIPMAYRRIFGGQLIAQALCVAAETVQEKGVKSLHATFPNQGDLASPVEYRVHRQGEGRTFAHRMVVGRQAGEVIVVANVSLHCEEAGLFHQTDFPEVLAPEDATAMDLSMIPWETRVVGGVDLASREIGSPDYAFWMRAPSFSAGQVVHQALLAHATDLSLIGTSLRPHAGLGEADSPEKIQTAVTSHTIWFHQPLRMDDWLLVSQKSPIVAAGRGFAHGSVLSREAALVASFAQESMLRPVSESSGS